MRGWADHVWLQGQRFGTVGCIRDGVPMEITTFRAEVYRPESRKPDVEYADDIETDLLATATSPSTRWRSGFPNPS